MRRCLKEVKKKKKDDQLCGQNFYSLSAIANFGFELNYNFTKPNLSCGFTTDMVFAVIKCQSNHLTKEAFAHEYNGFCNTTEYDYDGQKEACNCFHKNT